MSYLGNTPTTQSFISGTDYFNGTGAQTAFTLSRTVASVNDIQAVVNNVVQVPNDAYTISGTTITFTSAPSAGTQNVYVRYLSTTTQAITPSQNTVSWSTLDSNVQGDLGINNKNRIINGNMVIDQRNAGASVTATGSPFSVDRWQATVSQASKFTIQQNAGAVTPPVGFTNYVGVTSSSAYSVLTGDYFILNQTVEGFNIADLGWGTANAKTITISFWVRSSLTGTFGLALSNQDWNYSYPASYTISVANTWEYKTVTIAGPTAGTWNTNNNGGVRVQFGLGVGSTYNGTAGSWAAAQYLGTTGATSVVGTNGATFYITGVQLEVGTQATTFTTAGGSYGAELALCQRYAIVYGRDQVYNEVGGTGFSYSTTAANIPVAFPVQMRSTPTVTVSGNFQLSDGAAGYAGSGIAVVTGQSSTLIASVGVTASGLTAFRPYRLESANSTTATALFSAEL